MKTRKLFRVMMLLLLIVGATLTFSACSDDDDSSNGGLSGTWKVRDYGDSSVATNPDLNYVDWGEYMKFSSNKLVWNNRLDGNTTYEISWASSDTFVAVNVSNSSDIRTFSVIKHTSSVLVLFDTGDMIYRYLTK